MKLGVKIATIGGGSSYTPELMEGFIKRYEELPIREIWLVDVEEGSEKLRIVREMSQRMWDASPYDVQIYATLNRKEALKGADFVTTQFRVGQLDARVKDERIPAYYGMLGQETNGAGGMFKAFRTTPVVLAIVEEMKELCPNAWLINFANPSGMVTEAVVRYGHWKKVIGLCNVPVMAMMTEPGMLGEAKEDHIYKFAGLNHFHWHKVADAKGNDRTNELIDRLYADDNGLPKNIFDVPFFKEQLKQMQMIPCGYHRYYYREEEMLHHALEEYRTIGTRAQQVKETEAELFELYKDPKLDHKPEQLQKRGGAYYSDAACETIASIYGNKETQIVVSTKNDGAVPDLPADCVVEVTAYVGANGARNVAFGSLPPAERGWLQLMKNMELLTIEAAVTGDYGTALQAFTINPLVRSGETAKRIMDELFIAHEAYLPQFKQTIDRLKEEGIEVKDEVARNLIKVMEEI
ncbi:6-phospho-beta-glucosidase [Enterococcus durans]|uniref:6-phospho-beta-glucosidase n=1 Tax=Enterococcus durans TaxID=53345 RepID=UPI00288DC6ED|nr:6-phospho-beta-glucosidase [Enterococcus durans]MDT2835408.1 6-phospho-beta-glucosidase [Enterococcus durans]